jgi:serine/threonine protein phosphatase PrpC
MTTQRTYSSISLAALIIGLAATSCSLAFADTTTGDDGCLPHGCPLLPMDVVLDDKAREALLALRSYDEDERGNEIPLSDQDKMNALEALLSAGDADKTTLTLRGDKGGGEQINQDSATILSPYRIEGYDDDDDHHSKEAQLLGVFDGHGTLGEITSKHAATEIPRLLAEKLAALLPALEDEAAVSQAIKEAFVEVDQSDPTGGVGGATATMVLQLGAKLYIANAGDSRSFIGVLVDGEVDVVYQSRADLPDLPDERARITQMGGYVHIPPDPTQDVPRAYYVDEEGRARYGLAMSRSIGDWSVQGVIPEPIVDVVNVADLMTSAMAKYAEKCQSETYDEDDDDDDEDEEDEEDMEEAFEDEEKDKDTPKETCEALNAREIHIFAVSASDGMMDFLEPEQIAYVFAAAFFVEDNPHPHSAAEHLILQAAQDWNEAHDGHYRDDIAVASFKVLAGEHMLAEGSTINDEL